LRHFASKLRFPSSFFDADGRLVLRTRRSSAFSFGNMASYSGFPFRQCFRTGFSAFLSPRCFQAARTGYGLQKRWEQIDAELTLVAANEGSVLHYGAMIRPLAEQRWFHYVPFEEET